MNLEVSHIQQREDHWAIVDLKGKGWSYANDPDANVG